MEMRDHTKMIIKSSFLILIIILCASPSKGARLNTVRINSIDNEIEESDLWPNAVVPYYINENDFDSQQKLFIMTTFLRFASATCLKFLPVTTQPETYERIIIMENPDRLVKCPLHPVLHSKTHHKVTLASDCLQSPELDLILMHALGSQFNQENDKDIRKHFHDLNATYSLLCQQRDHQERGQYYEITRQKRGIDENSEFETNYTNVTTTKENIFNSNISENKNNNTEKPINMKEDILISLVRELGIDKNITDILNKLHKIGYVALFHVRNKYCNKSGLRTDSNGLGNVKVKKGLILNEAAHSFTVGDIFQYIISNVSSDRISFAGYGPDRYQSQHGYMHQALSGGIGYGASNLMDNMGEVPPEVIEAINEAPPEVVDKLNKMSKNELEHLMMEVALEDEPKVVPYFAPAFGKGLKDFGKKLGLDVLDRGVKEVGKKIYNGMKKAGKSVWDWMKNIG